MAMCCGIIVSAVRIKRLSWPANEGLHDQWYVGHPWSERHTGPGNLDRSRDLEDEVKGRGSCFGNGKAVDDALCVDVGGEATAQFIAIFDRGLS
jgi:hypothetical protein